jgi:hypothetical protein
MNWKQYREAGGAARDFQTLCFIFGFLLTPALATSFCPRARTVRGESIDCVRLMGIAFELLIVLARVLESLSGSESKNFFTLEMVDPIKSRKLYSESSLFAPDGGKDSPVLREETQDASRKASKKLQANHR